MRAKKEKEKRQKAKKQRRNVSKVCEFLKIRKRKRKVESGIGRSRQVFSNECLIAKFLFRYSRERTAPSLRSKNGDPRDDNSLSGGEKHSPSQLRSKMRRLLLSRNNLGRPMPPGTARSPPVPLLPHSEKKTCLRLSEIISPPPCNVFV